MKRCPACGGSRHYRLADGRRKCRVCGRRFSWYITPAEIQRDLDVFLRYYKQPSGYRLKGRIPAQALREALKRKILPSIIPEPEEATEASLEILAA